MCMPQTSGDREKERWKAQAAENSQFILIGNYSTDVAAVSILRSPFGPLNLLLRSPEAKAVPSDWRLFNMLYIGLYLKSDIQILMKFLSVICFFCQVHGWLTHLWHIELWCSNGKFKFEFGVCHFPFPVFFVAALLSIKCGKCQT